MYTQIDTAEAVYALLSAQASLSSALTDSGGVLNLYGPPGLPVEFSIRKALMYLGDGGPESNRTPIVREDFNFYCYGREASEAREIYKALAAVLRYLGHTRLTINGQTVVFEKAVRLSGPSDRIEPIEGWPFVYCSYTFQFIETPLA